MSAKGEPDSPISESGAVQGASAPPYATEAWFRGVVEAANEGIWIIDLEARTIFANGRMAAMLGKTPTLMLGLTPFDFLFEEDLEPARAVMESNFAGEQVEFEIRFRRADGSEIPVLGGSAPLRDEDGRITGSIATFSDLSARKVIEQALLEREREAKATAALLKQLMEAATDAIWMRDREGVFRVANPAACTVMGGTAGAEDVVGRSIYEIWGPEVGAHLTAETEEIFRHGHPITVEEEMFDAGNGRTTTFLSNKVPIYGADNVPIGLLGVSRDITDRKRVENDLRDNESKLAQQVDELKAAQQREHLLAREVDHRAKNLLTVVQSIIQLSNATDARALKDALIGRVQSLARAHILLAASRWEGVEFTRLLAEELEPFASGDPPRIAYSGPTLLLRPAAAQSLALVLHELVTNAAKYGSLSVPDGRLSIEWRLNDRAEESFLEIEWAESGGPAVTEPLESGFGSRLIRNSVERQLRGSMRRTWQSDGLRCTISLAAGEALAN